MNDATELTPTGRRSRGLPGVPHLRDANFDFPVCDAHDSSAGQPATTIDRYAVTCQRCREIMGALDTHMAATPAPAAYRVGWGYTANERKARADRTVLCGAPGIPRPFIRSGIRAVTCPACLQAAQGRTGVRR